MTTQPPDTTHADKEKLVAQFRAYLEQTGTDTSTATAEQGADHKTVDLFTLFTELAALRNEVKIEARQVKTALDQFRGLFGVVDQSHRRLGQELERGREANQRLRADCEREMLLTLIDLRDRIDAGLRSANGYRAGFPRRCKRREIGLIQALAEGMEITLRRLDETLARYGATALDSVGQPLDPHTMHAAATEQRPELEDGIVLSEIRKGFRRHGETLRPAEVIVNKRVSPP